MRYRHPHPLFILTNLRRFVWLLIVPLTRGFIAALRGRSIVSYLEGVSFDVLMLALILAFSILDWRMFRFRAEGGIIEFRRGVIFKRRGYLPAVATYTVEQPLLYRLLGAARLCADTAAGHFNRSDFEVVTSRRTAHDLIGSPTVRGHRPSALEVALMSFLASNSLAGILFLITTVRGVGQILGNEFSRIIFDRFQQLSAVLAFGIPPAAAAIGYLILFGWLLAFVANFLSFWGFRADRLGDDLVVRSGLIRKTGQRILAHDVAYLDIRRNLPSVLLRLYTVLVMAPGLDGKPAIIVPAAGAPATGQLVNRLLPRLRPDTPQIGPRPGSWVRYYSEPLSHMLYLILPALLLVYRFPSWQNVIVYITAMLLIIPIWGLAIRAADLSSAGAARGPGRLTLHYSTYFYVHTAVVSLDAIVAIKIQQTPIQRFFGACDVFVTSCVEQRFTTHRLRNYPRDEAARFFAL